MTEGTELKKKTLIEALAELQKKKITAKQSGTNPHFKSNYATLEDCWEACRKPLSDLGITVSQVVAGKELGGETQWFVQTTLVKGEDTLESAVPLVGATDMQKLGSAITYARRYGLITAVGILTGEDDDGQAASAREPSQAAPKATDSQRNLIFALFNEHEVPMETETAIREKLREGALTTSGATEVIDKLKELPKK